MQKIKFPTVLGMTSAQVSHRLAVAVKFSTILVSVVALYLLDLSIVFTGALNDESSFHILAIPFLFTYLLFRKRKMVNATIQQPKSKRNFFQKHFSELTGILLSASAILAYWYGSYTFTPLEYHMLTLPVLVAGLTLILFGIQTLKQLIFPIFFLFFLTPPPTEILYGVGSTLSNLSAQASNILANVFGLGSTLSSNYGSPLITITRPDNTIMNFSVDIACSGIYSLIGFIIFAIFIAYITQGKLRNKFAILIMGIPLIITLNIIRITTIITIGYYYGDQLALQIFHTIGATVLMFIGTLILLAITAKLFKKPKPSEPCQTCNQNRTFTQAVCFTCGKLLQFPKIKLSKSDLAKIASIAAAVIFLLSIQTPIFALTQGPAQVIIQTPSGSQGSTQVLPQIQDYNISFLYRDIAFEELSGQDAALSYVYRPSTEAKPTVFVSLEYAESLVPLHRWETCLVNYPLSTGQQPGVTELDLRDIQLQENPPIFARFFAFQDDRTNQTQVVLYWYETANILLINGTTQFKHVKMSVIIYPQSPEKVAETESQLLPIATAINNYWQPIKTWTTIALLISQNGLALSATTSTLLAALIIYESLLNRQEKRLLLTLYQKLPKQSQLLIIAVTNAAKIGKATTVEIVCELQKLTGTPNLENLTEKLQEAETAGLIEQKIVNHDDYPTIHWKSNLSQKAPDSNDFKNTFLRNFVFLSQSLQHLYSGQRLADTQT
jgi:exosortase